jgi:hypothetical protein
LIATLAGVVALTVTAAVCVMVPDPVTAAWIVFACANVELKFDVNTPLALVVPLTGENVQLVPTEHVGVTVLPLTPLLN